MPSASETGRRPAAQPCRAWRGPGGRSVVPANTFIATAAAVVRAGATPRFADVSEGTLLMTADTLAEAITLRTRAVIIVHLYGQMPDMADLVAVAQQAGIAVVEDAAQAHGAEWGGRRAGPFGAVACFSFYPAKNLGASGRGCRRNFAAGTGRRDTRTGQPWPVPRSVQYDHDRIGTNSRLDALQAIMLSASSLTLTSGPNAGSR